jgi:hypothetical protein
LQSWLLTQSPVTAQRKVTRNPPLAGEPIDADTRERLAAARFAFAARVRWALLAARLRESEHERCRLAPAHRPALTMGELAYRLWLLRTDISAYERRISRPLLLIACHYGRADRYSAALTVVCDRLHHDAGDLQYWQPA